MALFFMRGQRRETIDGLLPADVCWESPAVVETFVMQSRRPIAPYAKSLGTECITGEISAGAPYNRLVRYIVNHGCYRKLARGVLNGRFASRRRASTR